MAEAERTTEIIWMEEELDFRLSPEGVQKAQTLVRSFLDDTLNPEFNHSFSRPNETLPILDKEVDGLMGEIPITQVIDLSGGNIASRLASIKGAGLPSWNEFSMSRIRCADEPELPTSGHTVSHSRQELRETLLEQDLSHVLVLDDTSFTGNTSMLIEQLINRAFPDRTIDFSHGFLILNEGRIGDNPGAKGRLSRAIGGLAMHTPREDGWHIFDIIRQPNLERHLETVYKLLLAQRSGSESAIHEIFANEAMVRLLFPHLLTKQEMQKKERADRFIASTAISGRFHTANPQLLPNIVKCGHLLPIDEWSNGPEHVFDTLLQLGKLFSVEEG
jgi:hypothetical protein